MPPQYVKAYVKRNKNDLADDRGRSASGQTPVDALRAGEDGRATVQR